MSAVKAWIVVFLVLIIISLIFWYYARHKSAKKNVSLRASKQRPTLSAPESHSTQSAAYSPFTSPYYPVNPLRFGDPVDMPRPNIDDASIQRAPPPIGFKSNRTAPYPVNNLMPQPTRVSHSLDRIIHDTSNSNKRAPFLHANSAAYPPESICPYPTAGSVPYSPSSNASYPSRKRSPFLRATSTSCYPDSTAPYPPASNTPPLPPGNTSYRFKRRAPSPPTNSTPYPPASIAPYPPASSAPYPPAPSSPYPSVNGSYRPATDDAFSAVPPPPSYEETMKSNIR